MFGFVLGTLESFFETAIGLFERPNLRLGLRHRSTKLRRLRSHHDEHTDHRCKKQHYDDQDDEQRHATLSRKNCTDASRGIAA